MDKQEFMALAEKAYDNYEIKPESIMMFKLLQFEFDYNDEEKTCTIRCPITDIMLNPAGIVHGGIYTFISDTAMGHLNFRVKDTPYVTLDMNTSYFRATSTGEIVATARYSKEGHKVSFMECEVKNEQGDLLCKTTGTFYRYEKKK
ncbi:PaaI family thioesterase [Oceanobacillus halophilus]|uniref:PaaI family thioesterase n=1 Tax=Oceanobacillus halophilus TaxID=930130 RepID=UPI0013150196|nr:PaaI family thioesterase [Oceanobacillus halophilus]